MTAVQPNWLALETEHDSGVYNKQPIVMVRGEGSYVWDSEGNRYLDCMVGIGVGNLGHGHPAVVEAIQQQASQLMVMPQTFPNDKRAEFLSELVSVLPAGLDRVFLCNSGTEAVEAAMKFSITATGRHKFIACKRGFSGRSLGAVSLTWEPKYRSPFEPLIGPVEFIGFGDIEALRAALDDQTAAVLFEPVQGEGGVRPADAEFVRAARELTREKGALLIMDEIQTGFCRTGKFFAIEHFGVVPDGITLAKGIANGVPAGAFVTTHEVADKMPKGGHGTTFGGNPLAMAAGLAVIRTMKQERIWEQAAEKGEYFRQKLREINSPKIRDVRGLGLMIGVELKEKSAPYLSALAKAGVLALQASPLVVRFLPALTISYQDIDLAVEAFAKVLATNPKEA